MFEKNNPSKKKNFINEIISVHACRTHALVIAIKDALRQRYVLRQSQCNSANYKYSSNFALENKPFRSK